ncbi:hypothetical protein J6590_049800 [Homalodisca vitripennis]|nr:hypothetical protein J6590_049800 [Homalodisca vitripennis]
MLKRIRNRMFLLPPGNEGHCGLLRTEMKISIAKPAAITATKARNNKVKSPERCDGLTRTDEAIIDCSGVVFRSSNAGNEGKGHRAPGHNTSNLTAHIAESCLL